MVAFSVVHAYQFPAGRTEYRSTLLPFKHLVIIAPASGNEKWLMVKWTVLTGVEPGVLIGSAEL